MTASSVHNAARGPSASRPVRHRLVVNQMSMGSYRQGFLSALEACDNDVVFLVGDEHFGRGVVTKVSSRLVRRTGRNIFLLGRRVGWQRGCLVRGLLAGTLVVELNPRNLTSWLLLVLRGLTRRRTAGWGHAHSRRGPRREYNRGRRIMQRMCSDLVAYTETEARQLDDIFPRKEVTAARNSLYSRSEMSRLSVPDFDDRPDLIIIGRLIMEKKVPAGVAAFVRAAPQVPPDAVLHVIGSGPQDSEIADLVSATGMADRIRLHGDVTDLDDLAPLFQRCRALLAPGYVGLNAVQALGFGLPVLFARDEHHAPEIEALDPSNSIGFGSDDVESCSQVITGLYTGGVPFDCRAIAASARDNYSTDRMIAPFVTLGEDA